MGLTHITEDPPVEKKDREKRPYHKRGGIDKIGGEKEGSFLKLHVDINMKMD